ncbi:MAG TPA: DEAD/DEAH box helicase [Vicinamibacterales bacterium]|nr:DEAD/DEAH box helicase [Vicinamibacterales bacterium]
MPTGIVVARARRHLVFDVIDHGDCQSVRLAPLGAGAPLTLLRPFDRIDPIAVAGTARRAGRRRVARACAAAARGMHDAGEWWSAVDARIDIFPYQLEPALAVVRGETTRLLLADEVGLGKTIQAGLILSELRARNALGRALVLTPAGLRDQWAIELRERFAIEVTRLDAPGLAELQRTLPPWINPWTLPGVALASIDLLKRGELLPGLEHVTWDVVIVDEAHHATPGTHRHAAATLACGRARVAVLVSGTPHTGDASSFAALREIGTLPGDDPPLRTFRRTRADVADNGAGPRRTRIINVRRSAIELELQARLLEYTSRVWREASSASEARLAMIVLRKRALSGPESLARSLARRLAALPDAGQPAAIQLPLDFVDSLDGELIVDDEEPAAELRAPGLPDRATERRLLAALLDLARAASPHDSKGAALGRAIARSAEPAVIFTEYRDTLEDLRRRLEGVSTLVVLHGGMLPAERRRALAAFTAGRARVLLATDAASEGLNLQQRCRWVIHHEAPWSAVRVEQRNGRVDRLGQSRRVHVWHLTAAGSEEAGILARLAQRASLAARELAGTDAAVARAVFEGETLEIGAPRFGLNMGVGEASEPASRLVSAAREAERICLMRSLPRSGVASLRPVVASVKRRGAFRDFRRGEALAVFRAYVFDAAGGRLATRCAAVRGPNLEAARACAERFLGRWARRAIALHCLVERRGARREKALERALAGSPRHALQPSLFDRRVAAAGARAAAERAAALDEIGRRRDARAHALGARTVSVALVGAFVAR